MTLPFKSTKTLWILLVLLALAGCRGKEGTQSGAAAPAASFHAPRRVFFITVDTLRADHMSLYGYPRATTPNLAEAGGDGGDLRPRDHPVAEDRELVRGDVYRALSAHDRPHPPGGPAHPGALPDAAGALQGAGVPDLRRGLERRARRPIWAGTPASTSSRRPGGAASSRTSPSSSGRWRALPG